MLVGNRMTKNPVTAHPEDDLHEARRKMREGGFRRLPVTQEGKLVGIVTHRDMVPYSESVECKKVNEIMTRELKTVGPDTTLEAAAQILLDHKIGGLPVLDAGKLVGIITTSDILEAFLDATGVYVEETARVDMVVDNKHFDLAGASKIIDQEGGQILGLGTYRERRGGSPVFYIRFRSTDPGDLAQLLKSKGYNVLGIHS
jgi:acetoin utilization protein AcuB